MTEFNSLSEIRRMAHQSPVEVAEECERLFRETQRLRGVLDAILEVNCRTDSDTLFKVRELASNGLRRARV